MGNAFGDGHWRPFQAAALCLSGAVMAAGVVLAYMAWRQASFPFGVAAVVLLLAAPPLAVLALLARSAPDPGRAHSLIDGMHHAESTLRVIRMARAHVGVAAASTFLAWVCEAFELTDLRRFALCLTLLVAIAAAGSLPWLGRQEKLVREQREEYRRRLGEIRLAEGWFAG